MPNPVKAFVPLLEQAQADPTQANVDALAAAWAGYPADFIGYELGHIRAHVTAVTAADGEATVLPEARDWLQETRAALDAAQTDAATGPAITTYGALVTTAQATPNQANVDALVAGLPTFHDDYTAEVVAHFIVRLEEQEIARETGPPGRRKPDSRVWSANLRVALATSEHVVHTVAVAIAPGIEAP